MKYQKIERDKDSTTWKTQVKLRPFERRPFVSSPDEGPFLETWNFYLISIDLLQLLLPFNFFWCFWYYTYAGTEWQIAFAQPGNTRVFVIGTWIFLVGIWIFQTKLRWIFLKNYNVSMLILDTLDQTCNAFQTSKLFVPNIRLLKNSLHFNNNGNVILINLSAFAVIFLP